MLQDARGPTSPVESASTAGSGAGRGPERSPRRLFADDAGVLWTAELRRPRLPTGRGDAPAPLILFWSETRACLATLREGRGLAELSEDELRRHLRSCLSG